MKRLQGAIILPILLACSVPGAARSRAESAALQASGDALPAWLEKGKIRFARVDGGPIEVQKTMRSSWGERFTAQEREVLGDLYGKYGDRLVDLLTQAHVNFVWVTYSVGFSWQDEAAQRVAVRDFVSKLRRRGIHAAGYMCAVSLFWQSMFEDIPQSVRWVMFDPRGLPYRYSGGRDPLRFIADTRNPEWIDYQEKRVGAMIDDGLDAIFFDNTASSEWASDEGMASFFAEIRSFIRDKKHSNIPLFSNFGLSPSRAALNRYTNFTYDESWHEPGVRGADWDVSNVRRDRLLDGALLSWKPVITEYSIFHNGDRASTFLSPSSVKLSIAESAAFGTAYTWDMEGPFDAALMAREPRALGSWSAIGQYNSFLRDHSALYVGAANVAPLLILIPDDYKIDFGWRDSPTSAFFDLLAQHSVLYSVKPADRVKASEVDSYSAVVIPFFPALTSKEKQLVGDYLARGGKAYAFARRSDLGGLRCEVSSPELVDHLRDNPKAQEEVLARLTSLAPETTSIAVTGPPHVLANVTSLDQGNGIVVHFLNYDPSLATRVNFKLSVGKGLSSRLIGKQPVLASPDSQTSTRLVNMRWNSATFEGTLPALRTYCVLSLR